MPDPNCSLNLIDQLTMAPTWDPDHWNPNRSIGSWDMAHSGPHNPFCSKIGYSLLLESALSRRCVDQWRLKDIQTSSFTIHHHPNHFWSHSVNSMMSKNGVLGVVVPHQNILSSYCRMVFVFECPIPFPCEINTNSLWETCLVCFNFICRVTVMVEKHDFSRAKFFYFLNLLRWTSKQKFSWLKSLSGTRSRCRNSLEVFRRGVTRLRSRIF